MLHRGVTRRLEADGRPPAFLLNGPMAHNLQAARSQLELNGSAGGLYEAIPELSTRQFTVIVLRHLLGRPAKRIARHMGLDPRTVDCHGRKGEEHLRIRLGLPAPPARPRRKQDSDRRRRTPGRRPHPHRTP
ncbi:hypothetical protein SUDANB176_00274 [Streptomyces sp. enrichment culture]|uniref:sigma factor-like helix-turn-helix DNA-binding protein n=1 Tax=Streptomyces sp. enrichment culture TaxID=1795815 RepID=UPI003F54F3D7